MEKGIVSTIPVVNMSPSGVTEDQVTKRSLLGLLDLPVTPEGDMLTTGIVETIPFSMLINISSSLPVYF